MGADDPHADLHTRLERGRRRVDSATLGGPEWDAARALTDAIQRQIDALQPPPSVGATHIFSRLGPMPLEDGCLVGGTVAALGPDGEALRVEISEIPDRVHTRREFVQELEVVVHRAGFVLEIEGGEGELSFYAWDRGSDQPGDRAPG